VHGCTKKGELQKWVAQMGAQKKEGESNFPLAPLALDLILNTVTLFSAIDGSKIILRSTLLPSVTIAFYDFSEFFFHLLQKKR